MEGSAGTAAGQAESVAEVEERGVPVGWVGSAAGWEAVVVGNHNLTAQVQGGRVMVKEVVTEAAAGWDGWAAGWAATPGKEGWATAA